MIRPTLTSTRGTVKLLLDKTRSLRNETCLCNRQPETGHLEHLSQLSDVTFQLNDPIQRCLQSNFSWTLPIESEYEMSDT